MKRRDDNRVDLTGCYGPKSNFCCRHRKQHGAREIQPMTIAELSMHWVQLNWCPMARHPRTLWESSDHSSRFYRWSSAGIWQQIWASLASGCDWGLTPRPSSSFLVATNSCWALVLERRGLDIKPATPKAVSARTSTSKRWVSILGSRRAVQTPPEENEYPYLDRYM